MKYGEANLRSVLALSGLDGHAFDSFKSRSSSYMWLCDSLPRDLPGARIMLYGHELQNEEGGHLFNLKTAGAELRKYITRMAAIFKAKPLLFVAHSLGGIIMKEVGTSPSTDIAYNLYLIRSN
jgi:surfactin synthase thioesterase subunit